MHKGYLLSLNFQMKSYIQDMGDLPIESNRKQTITTYNMRKHKIFS